MHRARGEERVSKVSAYQTFIDNEGVPNITGFAVDDVRAVGVESCARPDYARVDKGMRTVHCEL